MALGMIPVSREFVIRLSLAAKCRSVAGADVRTHLRGESEVDTASRTKVGEVADTRLS